jgi:hypothetical protein
MLHATNNTVSHQDTMNKKLKVIFFTTGMIICSLLISVITYRLVVFKPYCSRIESIIQGAHSFYKQPSKELLDIAMLTEGGRLKSYVAQMSLISFGRDKQRMLKWHTEYILWIFLFRVHFDDRDIFTLWCHFAPYEKGTGLNESANFYYGRGIDQLQLKEIVSIIARVKAPSYYKDHPKELEERVNDILGRYTS